MMRFLTVISFLVLLVSTTSCNRLLRPTAGGKGNKGGNTKAPNGNNSNVNFKGTVIKNVVYSSAENFQGVNQQLALDVYKPENAAGNKFPVIFLLHGGGFVGGDKTNLTSTSSKLANNGYVVVSVNYRLGFGNTIRPSCADSNLVKQAIYRSVQDAYAAINYVIKRADEYSIDKDWVFIGGQSAGAITALMTAYLQNNAEVLFPNFNARLGPVSQSGSDFKIRGVLSMWGAFINPQFITAKTALPTIFFQGELDKAVPFNSRPFVACPTATKIYGTNPLYNRLKSLGVTTIAHVDPQGGHGVFEEDFRINNILCFLNDVRQDTKKQVYLTGVQNSCDK